jgi:nitrogenase molybdenum-iron protein alpha chain
MEIIDNYSEKRKLNRQSFIDSLQLNIVKKNDSKKLIMIPGIFYGGGCCYMACRGLATAPMKDVLVITHGPSGCAYFSWDNNRVDIGKHEMPAHRVRCFSTAMDEKDIIFGGEEKLAQAVEEAVNLFHPEVIVICATCPIGLIGDDIDKVARLAQKKFGIPIIAFSCEGLKTIPGYKIADTTFINEVFGTGSRPVGNFPINVMGEFYSGQNKLEVEQLLTSIGYDIVSALMGSTSYKDLQCAHLAALTINGSDKQIDDIMLLMQQKKGMASIKVDFTGITNIICSLRSIAQYFGDQDLKARTERVISQAAEEISDQWNAFKKKYSGMKAALFEDTFKSDHFHAMLADLGVDIITISQDYSKTEVTDKGFLFRFPAGLSEQTGGCQVLKDLVPQKSDSQVAYLLSRSQVKELLEVLQPDICFKGIVEQFEYESKSVQPRLFNSEERSVQYAGFKGFIQFARDLEMAIFSTHWENEAPAWAKRSEEVLSNAAK